MPLNAYGVLRARPVARRREGGTDTPHYQVHVVDADGTSYRIAVNVKSQQAPSELLYLVDDDFRHPITAAAAALAPGWHRARRRAPGGAASTSSAATSSTAPRCARCRPTSPGPDNDLADRSTTTSSARSPTRQRALYAFGERWGPETGERDKIFGFLPGNGVHDIHMNQGNSAQFARRRRRLAGRRLLLHFPARDRWVGGLPRVPDPGLAHRRHHRPRASSGAPDAGPAEDADGAIRDRRRAGQPDRAARPSARRSRCSTPRRPPVDLAGWRIADRLEAHLRRAGRARSRPAPRRGAARDGRPARQRAAARSRCSTPPAEGRRRRLHGRAGAAEGWTIVF